MTISEKIYKLRKDSHISQEELAMQMNVSRQAVSKWESGGAVPDTNNILLLSSIFQVSTDYLLQDNADLAPNQNSKPQKKSHLFIIGAIICTLGFLCALATAVYIFLDTPAATQAVESISFSINGYFIAAMLFAMILAIGAIILAIVHFRK